MSKEKIKSYLGKSINNLKAIKTKDAYKKMYVKMSKSVLTQPGIVAETAINDYLNKWKKLHGSASSKGFILYSNNNLKVDLNYVPDFIYGHLIEKVLNDARYKTYYSDKNLYKKSLSVGETYMPETFVRKIGNLYYDPSYERIYDIDQHIKTISRNCIIVKPSINSTGGRGISLFRKDKDSGDYFNDCGYELSAWMKQNDNLIIQEFAEQNTFYKNLNQSSVNTMRVVTYRSVSDEKPRVTQTLLRFGGDGSFVDNWHSGGRLVGIDENGFFKSHSYNMNFDKKEFVKAGCLAPFINEMHAVAVEIAKEYLFHRMLSFDFYVDNDNNVKIIEINTGCSPWFQFVTGPLFGEYADEVIEYCISNKGYNVLALPIK